MFLSCILGRFLLLDTFGTEIFGWNAGNRFMKRLHVHVIFIHNTLIGCFVLFRDVIEIIIFKFVRS